MKLHELYISRALRDARYKELLAAGMRVIRRRAGIQLIHPQYVKDFVGPEKYDTGLGNEVYKTFFKQLYVVEEV